MSSQGISGNNSIYNNLAIKPTTTNANPVKTDKTSVQQTNTQNYNSSATLSKIGSAATSISLTENQNTSERTAQQIISGLTLYKKNPTRFAAEVSKILQNDKERATLIRHFGLDSSINQKNLGIAMFLEAGEGLKREEMMPVGAVILNRALANNLAMAASGKTKVFNVSDIIRERNQFAIRGSYNTTMNGGRKDAIANGTSDIVQNMVKDLCKGDVGKQEKSETMFYFQRATLRNQAFRAGEHSFSATPSRVQYMNGNYLIGAGSNGYYQK
ncbi:MAG: hypothetical protein U0354_20060 [Candidatus Sericytochromatia bacterium]